MRVQLAQTIAELGLQVHRVHGCGMLRRRIPRMVVQLMGRWVALQKLGLVVMMRGHWLERLRHGRFH